MQLLPSHYQRAIRSVQKVLQLDYKEFFYIVTTDFNAFVGVFCQLFMPIKLNFYVCLSSHASAIATVALSQIYKVIGEAVILYFTFFARDSIYAKRAYAIAIPSVCLFVCLSVTRVDQSKTVEVRIMQFSPYSSPIPLVFVR